MPFKGVLLDLAGVLYQGSQAISGSQKAIGDLRAAQLPVRFVTNTTRSTKVQIHQQLREMGLNVGLEEIHTPVQAARHWLEAHSAAPHLLLHPAIECEFAGLKFGERKAVVIGDAGSSFNYDTLNSAFRSLMGDAHFLALAKNRTFKDRDGMLSLDAGAFVAALEYASGKEAIVLGKPSPDFFRMALLGMECSPHHAVMVGDDAESDIAGALAAGIGTAVLVRTGKYRASDEEKYEPRPTATVDNFSAAVDWILSRND